MGMSDPLIHEIMKEMEDIAGIMSITRGEASWHLEQEPFDNLAFLFLWPEGVPSRGVTPLGSQVASCIRGALDQFQQALNDPEP